MKKFNIKVGFHILLLSLLCLSARPQSVTITGKAPGAEGKTLFLSAPSDLITFYEKKISQVIVDSNGHFEIKADISQPVYASMSIGFHRVDLFLEPGRNYVIDIAAMNYRPSGESDPMLESQNLQVGFKEVDNNELNFLIENFNTLYNNFLLKNFNDLYQNHMKAKVDTFRISMGVEFPLTTNPYFANYIRYKIAGLEQLAQAYGKNQLAKRYFMDSPVLYGNVSYMDFFNDFFSKYFTAISRSLKFTDYNTILKGPENYRRMMKALSADTVLKNPRLRELVLLRGMMEMYYTKDYDQPSILNLLETVEKESQYPEHKEIASNMIRILTRLKPGTAAPAFRLEDRNKKMVSLEDFSGKPVVLCFWATYCQSCLSEMDLMKDMMAKYKDRVNFVSVSTDKEFLKMIYFLDLKKDYDWSFLFLGEQYDVLKDYDVRSYPYFVLIDEKGNIVSCPSDYPSAGLENSLNKLLTR
ncbi:MAG: TlpA disulfide reductase family protein [Bacteroidota bacterium]|nr:TlpA disulfide reductase family protein [Bacteroidota bacterium]